MRSILRALVADLVDFCFPPCCPVCGRAQLTDAICATCRSHFAWLGAELCRLCQEAEAHGGPRCPGCAARAGPLASLTAGVRFEGKAEAWIHRFKYPRGGLSALQGVDPAARAVVEEWVLGAVQLCPQPPECVVAVPLHARRLRSRGFNPAGLLARAVAATVGERPRSRLLERTRDTPSQTQLGRRERRRNVRGAFRCLDEPPRTVWLVDDVVTTGATLYEAARTLRRAGARRVVAVCAARTPRERPGGAPR